MERKYTYWYRWDSTNRCLLVSRDHDKVAGGHDYGKVRASSIKEAREIAQEATGPDRREEPIY